MPGLCATLDSARTIVPASFCSGVGVGPDRYMTIRDRGVDDFGTVQFQYTSYVTIQPVLLSYSTAFEPFRYIMRSDCKKALNVFV